MALSNKQQVWIESYLKCWNATEAGRIAGYAFPNVEGPKNLVNPSIKAIIDTRIAELAMSADEVLIRLAKMGRSNIADFAHVKTSSDLAKLGHAGELVKKFKSEVITDMLGRMHEKVELELYDAQAPLINIGKQHGLFTDKHIIEMRLEKEIDGILDQLEGLLPPELYDRVLNALSGTEAGEETPAEPQSAAVE